MWSCFTSVWPYALTYGEGLLVLPGAAGGADGDEVVVEQQAGAGGAGRRHHRGTGLRGSMTGGGERARKVTGEDGGGWCYGCGTSTALGDLTA